MAGRTMNSDSLARNLAALSACGALLLLGCTHPALWSEPGFSFDCDLSTGNPCRALVGIHEGRRIPFEPSGVTWSRRFGKAIVVTDNYEDISPIGAGHFAISFFDLEGGEREIPLTPLLSPEQAREFELYDLEGVTLIGDRLYAIGSLGLHRDDPSRDRWQRNQFVQMDLEEKDGVLRAVNLIHVSERWPDFRDWVVSESGYGWTGEEVRGRAEGVGINVEGLSSTIEDTLLIGFRGPQARDGGSLVLEIRPPVSPDLQPVLVTNHSVPALDPDLVARDTPRTVRSILQCRGEPREFYVLLGPMGPEKESTVLARWHVEGTLTKATELPYGMVPEGVTVIHEGRLLIVDDLNVTLMIATEN